MPVPHPLFAPEFKAKPYWWDAHEPAALPEIDVPKDVFLQVVELAELPGRSLDR